METKKDIAILGGGNIGLAIAKGLVTSSLFPPGKDYYYEKENRFA